MEGAGQGLLVCVTANARGLWAGILAFTVWGVLPVYWVHLDFLAPGSIVAQRTLWTCVLLWPLVLLRRRALRADLRTVLWHLLSGVLIGGNWIVYVWATLNERMIEGALGYYINPFFNILFGFLWFGERQNRLQLVAVGVAFAGVMMQMPGVGHFPWVAVYLGITFSMYGVVRKRSKLGAVDGLAVETTILLPLALVWLFWHHSTVGDAFGGSWDRGFLLAGAGILTAIPLLLFAFASRKIRLSTLGMLQFIGPTLQFFIGWLVYDEPMNGVRFASFGLIWVAIGIYVFEGYRVRERKL